MADFQADGHFMSAYEEQPHPRTGAGRMRMAGAVLSLLIVAGIGYWGYRMVMRDVSGVPVVRAMKGETRRVPADAGGSQARFQGLSVNRIAEGDTAAAPANKVDLAPAPVNLGDDALTPEQLGEKGDAAPAKPQSLEDIASRLATIGDPAATTDDDAQQGTPQLVSGAGLDEAVRPKLRPTALASRPADAPAAAAPAGKSLDVDPAAVPPGTFLAQVGAFASDSIAKQEWDKIAKDFSIYFDGKQRVIEVAESGGHTFYRLRVMGFNDISDARRFCSALVAGRVDCIPVLNK